MNSAGEGAGSARMSHDEQTAATRSMVAQFEIADKSVLRRVHLFLHARPTVVPFIVLLISVVLFRAIAGSQFFDPFNLSLIFQQVTVIAILATAQTLIILTAGIDLSVGAIMILSSVLMARLAVFAGVPVEIAFALGLLCGVACGFVNGTLVAVLKLPPFIVTFGTWSIFAALYLGYSRGTTIRQQDIEATAPFLHSMGTVIQIGDARVTYGSILLILLTILIWYVLNHTAFGRHIYATGDDPDAASRAGINTRRTLISVYVIAGLICAIASWVAIGRNGAVSPIASKYANLESITAVLIGGTSLFGGRGSIVGTLVGALIVGVYRNGLALAGAPAFWQVFAIGSLIILAAALDQWIRRVSA